VPDPQRFGVAEFDDGGRIVHFEEKPEHPKSDLIPIGVYFLRPDAFGVIDRLEPSRRGEFEITDVLNHYIPRDGLFWHRYTGQWADAGTVPSLLHAAALVEADAKRGMLLPPVPHTGVVEQPAAAAVKRAIFTRPIGNGNGNGHTDLLPSDLVLEVAAS